MMRSIITKGIATTLAAASLTIGALAQAPSTAFTYQGFLRLQGTPANGVYDLQFRLFDVAQGGNPIALYNAEDVNIREGLFTVEVDFGTAPFTGQRLWIEIGVRRGDQSRPHVILDPRIELTPVPYALFSQKAKDAQNVPWSGITGMPEGFADGIDDDTTYTAGAGLALNGTTFEIAQNGVNTNMIADGAVTDEKIDSVSWNKVTDAPAFLRGVSVNFPLQGNGTSNEPLKLANGTNTGQVLRWNGSRWEAGWPFWFPSEGGIMYHGPTYTYWGIAHFWSGWQPAVRIYGNNWAIYADWPGDWGGGIETWDIVCASIRYDHTHRRSDSRLKQDVASLNASESLQRIMALRPVSYRYIPDIQRGNNRQQYGFIAQELQTVFPELVEAGGEQGILAVDYIALIPHMVSVIQKQQAEIEELRALIQKLQSGTSASQ